MVDESVTVLHLHKFVPGAIELPAQSNTSSISTPDESAKRRKIKEEQPLPQPPAPAARFARVTGWHPAGDNSDIGTVDIEISV